MEKTEKYTEEALVKLLKKGDNDGFSYLYIHYSRSLFRIIHAIIPDQELASDVLQEVFVHIFKKIYSYDDSRNKLYTWMAAIARNLSLDILQSKAYRNGKMNTDILSAKNLPSPFRLQHVDDFSIRRLFAMLKPKYSLLLELNYFEGYTQDEIAKMYNLPLGTVKSRIRAGLQKLKLMMKE